MSEQQELQPVFSIEKIYVKDLSLEIQSSMTITVTAKVGDKTMFLCEVTQAGIFQIRNLPAEDIDPILGVACPNILFPYARETVSNLVGRAGFPPVLLSPINFEALYMQQRAEQAEAGNA